MKKKIVLISGGSSGIGKHIVKNLLKDNFYVINLTRKRTYLKSGNYENYIIKNFDNKSDLKVFFHFIKKNTKKYMLSLIMLDQVLKAMEVQILLKI